MAKKDNRHAELVSASVNIEAPYELPEGWKWCRLGDVAKFIGGGTPDKSNPSYWNGKIPWASVKDIKGDFLFSTEDFITELGLQESSTSLCDENGLILVTRISPGKSIISKIKTAINQDLKIVETEQFKPFLKYFFDFYEEEIKLLSSGTTVKGIKLDILDSLFFPLPPTLAEQQRIVNRIESMFAKLDEAKEKAQTVVDSFETRKAAILHKAFTGELTANWRKENDVSDDSWEEKTLQDICIKEITDGTHKTPIYVDEKTGVPFISGKDVSNEIIDWSDLRYIPNELHNELYERLAPQIDDILLSKNGARLGKAAIVETDLVFDIYVTLALLRPNKDTILPRYLWRIINSPVIQSQIQEHLTGIGMPNLHLRDIKVMVIKVPSLCEQQEIVRILDTVLEKETRAKEAAEQVLEQIALLKKSILAKAFRGEL